MLSREFWLIIDALLCLAIIISHYNNRIRLTKILAFVLIITGTFTIVRWYLFNPLLWIILCIPFLIGIFKKYGLNKVFWIPLAFFLWVPFYMPPPQILSFFLERVSLPEIFIFFGFICWLAYAVVSYRRHGICLKSIPYWKWLGLFLVGGNISFFIGSWINQLPGYDQQAAFVFLREICFFSVAVYLFSIQTIRTPKEAENIFLALLIGAMMMSTLILLGDRPESYIEPIAGRVMGQYQLPLGHVLRVGGNTTAAYYAMITLLSCSLWLNGQLRLHKLMGICIFSISIVMVFLLATRAIWILIVPSIILVIVLSVRKSNASLKKIFVALGLSVIIVAGIFIYYEISEDVSYRIESLQSTDILSSDETLLYRIEQYIHFGPLIIKNPLGLGSMNFYPPIMKAPHSLYLKLGLTTGIIGFVGYLTFLFLVMRYLYIKLPFVPHQVHWMIIGTISTIFLIFAFGISGDILWRFPIHSTFILMCGLAIAAVQSSQET